MMMERNDPTRTGFTPPPTGTVRLSGNEVEALCMKAARGAGFDWGLAEEAGFAARWLFERGIDGPGALLAHLDRSAGAFSQVVMVDGVLSRKGEGLLSPIVVGTALSDFAALGRDRFRAGPVDRPVLVLPFIQQVAATSQCPLTLNWPGGFVSVTPEGEISGQSKALASMASAEISIAPGIRHPSAPRCSLAVPAADTLARLNAFAMLTCVAASAASRADAGSANGDND